MEKTSQLFLKRLDLHCFRNYSSLRFSPSSQSLIVGGNGQGKTNILEALTLLFTGCSFRASLPETLIQEGRLSTCISAEVFEGDKKSFLKFILEDSGKRQFLINNKRSSFSSLYRQLPLIVFNPESLNLLKGPAENRRWWLDHWLGLQEKKSFSRDFKKALLQKNQLLKQVKKGFVSKKKAQALLESINEIFVEKSLHLVKARRLALEELNLFLAESAEFIFRDFKGENNTIRKNKELKIGLSYTMKGQEQDSFIKREELFKQNSSKRLFQEMEAGLSLYGAHRDDFKVFFQSRDSRYFCSQGQQRALLLSIKIAQILWLFRVRKNRGLLLLLDDVFSEIDKHLIFNLLQFLNEIPSQIILTSTEIPSFLDKRKFQVFYLNEGVLRKENTSGRKNESSHPTP